MKDHKFEGKRSSGEKSEGRSNGGFGKRSGSSFGDRKSFGGKSFGGKKFGGSSFGGKSFGDRKSFDHKRGSDFRDREVTMYKATCAECSNACEVPFRPNGEKPVLCNVCFGVKKEAESFGGRENSSPDRFEKRDYEPKVKSGDWNRENKSVEVKLDLASETKISELKSEMGAMHEKIETLTQTLAKISTALSDAQRAISEIKNNPATKIISAKIEKTKTVKVVAKTPPVKTETKTLVKAETKSAPKAANSKVVKTLNTKSTKKIEVKTAPKKTIEKKAVKAPAGKSATNSTKSVISSTKTISPKKKVEIKKK